MAKLVEMDFELPDGLDMALGISVKVFKMTDGRMMYIQKIPVEELYDA